ncbi:MAG TPA: T9SS type A sorting domain-containing protein [Ferruginibacter sp.]|nr:T9SS type A sorting domain-containing protein [Ferruginibacter sp.]
MRSSSICLFVFFLSVFTPAAQLCCQCLTAPTATCTNTEPLVVDGETLHLNTSKWYYGPTVVFNQLSLNGGTLVVCGNLTIDKFFMDSGKVFVQPGGRLVIGNGIGAGLVIRGNSFFYNYGTLEILRNLSFENGWASPAKPNVLINATASSVFKMNNQYFVINNANSWFVNKGKAFFHGIITDPQAAVRSVCLGRGSQTAMTILINKVKNAYFAPEPYACVSVSEFSQIWDTLTSINPYVRMCLGLTHRLDSSCMPFGCKPSWGMADIFRGCLSCSSIHVLPTSFTSFHAEAKSNGNVLSWEMEHRATTAAFFIERSADGLQFRNIHSMPAGKYSNTKSYDWTDMHSFPGENYYRVKYLDTASGMTIYSAVIKLNSKQSSLVLVYPNPFTDQLFVSLAEKRTPVEMTLVNSFGTIVSRQSLVSTAGKWQVKWPSDCAAGIYMMVIKAAGKSWNLKVIKQ